MLGFTLAEEQRLLCHTVRQFAETELAPLAARHDELEEFPAGLLPKLGAAGLTGVIVPEELGGAGAGNMGLVLMLEQLGRVDAATAFTLQGYYHVVRYLLTAASRAQQERHLVPLARGAGLGAMALTEPEAGSDAAAIRTAARPADGGWVLDGGKCFITNAGLASTYVVIARTAPRGGRGEGISAFVVEAGTPGLIVGPRHRKLGVRASLTQEVRLEGCRVGGEALLGQAGHAYRTLTRSLGLDRLANAGTSIGLAQGALEHGIRYVGERQAFGRRVAEFQGIRWQLAELATQVEAARLLVYQAAWLADHGNPDLGKVAMAKLAANEAVMRVTTDVVQLYGGHGYMREHPVERFMRDARVFGIGGGTTHVLKNLIAQGLLR